MLINDCYSRRNRYLKHLKRYTFVLKVAKYYFEVVYYRIVENNMVSKPET